MTFLSLAAAQALAYTCTVNAPLGIDVKGNTATAHVITVQPAISQSKFDLTLRESGGRVEASLQWQDDPITAGSGGTALSEGPHDYAFVSVHPGPCVFTVTSCLTMVTVSQQADGTAEILIQPSALATDADRSKPFPAIITGHCIPKGRA